MLEALWEQVQSLLALGSNVSDVGVVPVALRTVVIYLFTLAIVRLGSKRFLGRATAFDVIVAIMLGSIMSRAINSSAPFFPTMVSGAALVGLHWLFATLAFHTDWFGTFVKGSPLLLVKDGDIQWDAMQEASLSRQDFDEALRMEGMPPDPSKVQVAYLERNGRISVIPRRDEPRVCEVSVEKGVRTIRIELP